MTDDAVKSGASTDTRKVIWPPSRWGFGFVFNHFHNAFLVSDLLPLKVFKNRNKMVGNIS